MTRKGNLTMLLVLAIVIIFAMLATVSLLASSMYKQSVTGGNLQGTADLRAVSEIVSIQGEAYLTKGFANGTLSSTSFASSGSASADALADRISVYIPSNLKPFFEITDAVIEKNVEFTNEKGATTQMDLIVIKISYKENGEDKICNIGFFNNVSTGYFGVGNYGKGDFVTLWTS